MFPEKIVKIVLKRCDEATKSKTMPKQNSGSKVEIENRSDFSAATIEVKNEFITHEIVSKRTIKGETSNSVTDDSPKPAADDCGRTVRGYASVPQLNVRFSSNDLTDCKQFGFQQTDVVVKMEREGNNLITRELVGCKGEDDLFITEADDREVMRKANGKNRAGNVSACFNLPTDLDQFRCPQTNLQIKTERAEEEGAVENELVCRTVAEDSPNIRDAEILAESEKDLPDKGKNRTKMMKVEITSELVARLSKGLEDNKGDRNLLLKVVKSEESEISSQFDLNCFSVIRGNSSSKKVTSKKCRAKVTEAGNSKTLLTSRFTEAPFECSHCSARFKRKYMLKRHIGSRHSENAYTCSYCSASFKTRKLIVSHIISHLSEKPYSCPHCSRTFKNRYNLGLHLVCFTGEANCPSKSCLAKFSHRCGLRAHLHSVHPDEKHFSCDQCPARFSRSECLKGHLSVHSNLRNYVCSQCPAKFKNYRCLYGHIKSHSEEKRYGCALCSLRFKIKHTLIRHLNVVHFRAEKSFACDQCSAKFHRKDALKEHFLVHSREKSFACDQCPAKFNTSSKLKRHASVHSEERPFTCEKCPKSFKSSRTLQRHARIHSGVNLHSCDQCPAKFVARFILKDHLEAAHSKDIFTCEICSRRLKSKKCLQLHLKTVHSSKRPYSCPHCPLKFLSSRHLKTHSTLHSGQRRFSCAQCPAKFMERCDLRKHLVVHTDVKAFICAQCSSRYKHRNGLIYHLKKCLKQSNLASFSS